ncbi:hypothetical protein [Mycobacterium malmoense]|uniref:hypothetical protein n=1 Tax=Mycobacterium malmoense TaxID=1780 RepID=UPI00114D4AB5|nr:hypothetical protein [Mycobacterium malmoense]
MSYAPRDPEVARWRASVARRAQSYSPDDPCFLAAKQNLDFAKAKAHLARVVAEWGPPAAEQRSAFDAILSG